jgi:hypothetical protein
MRCSYYHKYQGEMRTVNNFDTVMHKDYTVIQCGINVVQQVTIVVS